ncbi:MAG TPA: DUF547 domain-containing protein [Chthoniobacteraceae bacterium]|nr:DUF547 domain-containing protein [Chthoniobacteraceae bacterium]
MELRLFLRRIALGALLLASVTAGRAEQFPKWIPIYNGLLGKYVTSSGVRYAAWKNNAADMQAIQQVVDGIAAEKVSGLSKKEELAFYINAYNAWILHEALAKYPTKSVKDLLFTFFTGQRIKVAGEKMSFNHLEKDIIRPKFGEPRVHCALNCASRSCPPLNREAFQADKLDVQLEKLAVAFVNSPKGVDYSAEKKSAALSSIFNWYKDDFKAVGGPIAFINKRRNVPLPNDVKITYQSYDWSLNEVR